MRRRLPVRAVLAGAVLSVLAAGCQDETPPPVDIVRPIKHMTVNERAQGQVRRIAGVIEAAETTSLSFQVSGNLQTVLVDLGDRVTTGQILAELDKEPYQLAVEAAEADVAQARARLTDAQESYKRTSKLFEARHVSRAQLDAAQAELDAARGQVKAATAQLDIARRDLRNTTLTAPFDGRVAARDIEPFQDVAAGQRLFDLEGDDALEAAVLLPEPLIRFIQVGMPVEIVIPSLRNPGQVVGDNNDVRMAGTVTEIGSRADSGNAFPLTVSLFDPDPNVRPGMTAEVIFTFDEAAEQTAFLVPFSAILLGEEARQGYVFRFEPASGGEDGHGVVRKVLIRGRNIHGNRAEVFEGLEGGEVIATAGVHFLHDGQTVRLATPADIGARLPSDADDGSGVSDGEP